MPPHVPVKRNLIQVIVRSARIGIKDPVVEPVDEPRGLALAVRVQREKANKKDNEHGQWIPVVLKQFDALSGQPVALKGKAETGATEACLFRVVLLVLCMHNRDDEDVECFPLNPIAFGNILMQSNFRTLDLVRKDLGENLPIKVIISLG